MNATLRKLKVVGAAGLAALCVFGSAPGVTLAKTYPEAAQKALEWTRTQQQGDGSFAGFGVGSTVDAVLAFLAAGQDPSALTQGGSTPITFLESHVGDLAKTPGSAGKMLVAAARLTQAGGQYIGAKQLTQAVSLSYDPGTGHYGKDAIGHAFAVLGVAATGQVPSDAAKYLKAIQTRDGGWAFTGDTAAGAADTNTTAVAVQALIAAGEPETSPVIQRALAYLATQQNPDGGYPYQKGGEFGSESDVNSSAYVMQALIAASSDTQKVGDYLLSMQKPNGAFQWKKSEPDDNAGATYQAIPALLGVTLVDTMSINGGGSPADQGGQPVGMPRTGQSDPLFWILEFGSWMSGCLAIGTGLALRRRASAR
ncbi:MAG TPA: prenyltransferase/squalene oxidase repeat-containing protein [Chloroflexia bacterium]|nr:prenyltransferase/squalene oxidase repeat-containing protein [Chloroflexia bacterium]